LIGGSPKARRPRSGLITKEVTGGEEKTGGLGGKNLGASRKKLELISIIAEED